MVSVVNGSSSSGISVSWKEPSCSDINDVQVTEYKIRYGIRSETQQRTVIPAINSGTMQYTISGNDLELFTEYSIEVAAVNSRGEGQYSQPKTAVITGGEFLYTNYKELMMILYLITVPGPVSSLSTAPDILSVVLKWGHPQQGMGHITQYEIRHSLATSVLGIKRISGALTSYRVGRLQPGMQYRFEIRPFIESLDGPSEQVTAKTLVLSKRIFLSNSTHVTVT